MTTWVFDSSQTGLSGISGQVGTLIAQLDIILSGTGFNSSSTGWGVTRSGSVATYTKTAHGMGVAGAPGIVLTMTGWNETEYNITDKNVTIVDANTITCTIAGTPATPGTGTATVKRSSLGWTKQWAGTNLATYKQKTGTNQFALGVDDAGTNVARIRGFESMTAAGVAVASGTNPFPTDAQLSGGCFVTKSSTADATLRSWICYSDGKIFHFITQHSGLTTTGNGFRFGDFYSRKSGDIYNTLINGDIVTAAATTAIRVSNLVSTMSTISGLWVARPYTGTVGSIAAGFITDGIRSTVSIEMGAGGATYPHPIEGGIIPMPIWISEGTAASGVRGTLPGAWNVCHARPLATLDSFSGVGGTSMANKTFQVFNTGSAAQCCHETSDTWTAPN
jgi:hypothetical protein